MKSAKSTNRRKGTYALVLELPVEVCLRVGKLGKLRLPRGFYVYAGSAKGGLGPRVKRHILRGKPLHWHIDYLREEADLLEVWWSTAESMSECDWYEAALGLREASVPVKGFGSSDCRCISHLVHIPSRPLVQALRRRFPEARICRSRALTMGLGESQTR